MEWMEYKEKKVFVQIDTMYGVRSYSGIVQDVSFMGKNTLGIEVWFIEIRDKFGEKVGFTSNAIKLIQEEK